MLAAFALCGLTAFASGSGCTFHSGVDCTEVMTPPGFLRHFGTDVAAQLKCCALCSANRGCAVAVLALDQGGVCMLKPNGTTCASTSTPRMACLPPNRPLPGPPGPPGPPRPGPPPPATKNSVPKWKSTFNMSESTVVMPCNCGLPNHPLSLPALALTTASAACSAPSTRRPALLLSTPPTRRPLSPDTSPQTPVSMTTRHIPSWPSSGWSTTTGQTRRGHGWT